MVSVYSRKTICEEGIIMRLEFIGAAHEVTGSATLLTTEKYRILVDYGLEQGNNLYDNIDFPIAPGDIDCVLLTHAHIDHSGRLPVLVAQGFTGPIYTTVPTTRLCRIMLLDSAHIQEQEAEWKNRKSKRAGAGEVEPLYTTNDANAAIQLLEGIEYDKEREILPGVSICFRDAGHLLGSASIEVKVTEAGETKTLLFSGDLGNTERPLLRNYELPKPADYVVIESTYGGRKHAERRDYLGQLTRILQETFRRGGNVVIPAFAVGRTQELLYLIREIKERGLMDEFGDFQVWVDSPLAVEATNIYSMDMLSYCDEETAELLRDGVNPIRFPGLRTSITSDDSKWINADPTPKVILSASGMCEAGRIRHHLKHNLWRSESTILFVGYQAEGTLGNALLNGADTIKLFGEEITVKAQLEQMDGISGHSDEPLLLNWLAALKDNPPVKVFVNHGQDEVTDLFAHTIEETFGWDAEAPYSGGIYELGDTVRCIEKGVTEHVPERTPRQAAAKASAVFERLLMAGRRLMSVIEHNRGGANKDLAKFADQIDALSTKWDR